VFGTLPRVPRPVILILVYGVFLILVGITATAQSALVASHFSTSTLNAVVGSDAATTRAFVNAYVQPRYLDPNAGPNAQERSTLAAQLATLTEQAEIVRVELRLPDGRLIAASDTADPALSEATQGAFGVASGGRTQAMIVEAAAVDGTGKTLAGTSNVLVEFLPLTSGGQVPAVMGIWRDADPILAKLDVVRRDVVLLTLSAGLIAALALYLIFRAAQRRLTRQTIQLVESTRRDPLTGLLNHGALVGTLAGFVEAAKAAGGSLAIALLDLDNFRLLNEQHGPAAGDEALRNLARLVEGHAAKNVTVGRSGPDEFLLLGVGEAASNLEGEVLAIQSDLAGLSLQFEATERLPITISGAIARFPEHGASMTVLLATAARTLAEAKAGGGDTILVASRSVDEEAPAAGFDVLQGLVHAVDTKDRYTKRHSADVSRYGLFIAQQLELDADLQETIRLAGLLHDVGKIGIPDAILRKPGRLTADEGAIMRQHVAVGEMIVRDVPNLEVVRAGIRHHHERWDGTGYLERLAAEEIPLIARILAVADTFSAMTTTRPYRKALDVQEATRRLEDAAGTQLDARLVRTFVDGLESAEDPPLPEHSATARLVRLHVA
jgi:diguanylate cyclase (GGDEF)-like protein/putative nucleotidyltransferase with HDIG domain